MTDICLCDNTTTRQQIREDNNLCPICKKQYRDPADFHTNNNNLGRELGEISEDNTFYENTDEAFGIAGREQEYINLPLKKDPFWFDNEVTNRETESVDKSVCSCDNQQITGIFCASCGGKTAFESFFEKSESYYVDSLSPEVESENNGQLFGSVKLRPRVNQRLFSIPEISEGNSTENHLYSRIALAGEHIQTTNLEKFANIYNLEDTDRLEIFQVPQINREIVLVHNENQENLDNEVWNEGNLNLQVRDNINNLGLREINHEPDKLIPHIYDDIVPERILGMDRRLQNIRPPRFDSTKANIRTFFTRFDKYKDAHEPNWEDDIALNIISNLLDDESLEYFESLEERHSK